MKVNEVLMLRVYHIFFVIVLRYVAEWIFFQCLPLQHIFRLSSLVEARPTASKEQKAACDKALCAAVSSTKNCCMDCDFSTLPATRFHNVCVALSHIQKQSVEDAYKVSVKSTLTFSRLELTTAGPLQLYTQRIYASKWGDAVVSRCKAFTTPQGKPYFRLFLIIGVLAENVGNKNERHLLSTLSHAAVGIEWGDGWITPTIASQENGKTKVVCPSPDGLFPYQLFLKKSGKKPQNFLVYLNRVYEIAQEKFKPNENYGDLLFPLFQEEKEGSDCDECKINLINILGMQNSKRSKIKQLDFLQNSCAIVSCEWDTSAGAQKAHSPPTTRSPSEYIKKFDRVASTCTMNAESPGGVCPILSSHLFYSVRKRLMKIPETHNGIRVALDDDTTLSISKKCKSGTLAIVDKIREYHTNKGGKLNVCAAVKSSNFIFMEENSIDERRKILWNALKDTVVDDKIPFAFEKADNE